MGYYESEYPQLMPLWVLVRATGSTPEEFMKDKKIIIKDR